MIRILHIARYATVSIERRVVLMAAQPGFSFRLIRPRPVGGPFDAESIRDPNVFERVRHVRTWLADDPHRGIYGTLTFDIRRAAPDVIHAEEEPDSLAALHVSAARRVLRPRARLVINTWQNVNRLKRPGVARVLRRTLAAADAITCGNAGAVAVLREQGYTGPAPVIPALALDAEIFHRRDVPRLDNAFTVGFVGRLAPEKGVDTLVRAIARMGPPVRLVLAGDGPCRAALAAQAQAEGVGDAVRFAGSLDPRQVAEFLSAIDVLVLPSRSTPVWQEQFGRVLVEAMGCETPVVGSDSGAIPAVVGDAGLVFPEDDVPALVERLRRLRESPHLRLELGRRGSAWARTEHSPARRAGQMTDFYRQLVREPARRIR
jgi:glycosyltransferase involved in cell wall biosynthesis